jgi:hypothetical protein
MPARDCIQVNYEVRIHALGIDAFDFAGATARKVFHLADRVGFSFPVPTSTKDSPAKGKREIAQGLRRRPRNRGTRRQYASHASP